MYVSSSMATVNMAMCNMVVSVCTVLVVFFIAILGATMDRGALQEQIMEISIVKKVSASFLSLWLKGMLALAMCSPYILYYLALQLFNWLLRTVFMCHKQADKEHRKGEAAAVGRTWSAMGIAGWPWAQVIDRGLLVGLLFVMVQVGMQIMIMACDRKTVKPCCN